MFSGILGIAGAGAGGPARQIDTTPKITINSSKRQRRREVVESAAGVVLSKLKRPTADEARRRSPMLSRIEKHSK